jgi:hypothetical protein
MNLVAPLGDVEGRYSFIEDGLPAYLMLAANQMKFAAGQSRSGPRLRLATRGKRFNDLG